MMITCATAPRQHVSADVHRALPTTIPIPSNRNPFNVATEIDAIDLSKRFCRQTMPRASAFKARTSQPMQLLSLRQIAYAGAIIGLMGTAAAYPCNNHHSAVGFFINGDASLYGTVYGRAVNCVEAPAASAQSCSPAADNSIMCVPKSYLQGHPTNNAKHHVKSAMALLRQCGFDEVYELPEFAQVPLVNPKLSAHLGVIVSVNRRTASSGGADIDPAIACLEALA